MLANRFLLLAVTLSTCAAVAYVVGRNAQQKEGKQQLKEDLRSWESEGGTAAPAKPHTVSS